MSRRFRNAFVTTQEMYVNKQDGRVSSDESSGESIRIPLPSAALNGQLFSLSTSTFPLVIIVC